MPAFTFVASVIVAEVGGIMLAAAIGSAGVAFVTSVIATGLAYVTARLISGGSSGGGGTVQDPGVRIQLPPATDNKIPIVYGSAYTRGVITDARISNENKTMTYVLVLSEKTQTGTFSIGEIFWNDSLLVFDPDAGESHIVRSSIDQNGNGDTSTNYDGLIRVRVYAGNVNAGSQIFPPQATGNTVAATTTLDEGDVKCPAGYALNGLIFAVVQVDYNSEKGTTGLGQLTFQVNNTLNNPGLVWYDYMTSTRYGAGIPANQIDTFSSTDSGNALSLYSISNTVPSNQYESDGTTPSSQARYIINGVLSTGDTCRNNLERINMACASWTTYDISAGTWKVIVNRAATNSEVTNAFLFNDDNIIGDVGITATNLEDLYNQLEVEFPSRTIRDQNEYYRAETPSGERNNLEPDNKLNMRIDLVNNALHSARLGLIELKQSRIDKIITFRSDYSGIQIEAGDVVKVTNDVYGFSSKLFRVTKTREVEDESGGLQVEITALEYNVDVYDDEDLDDYAASAAIGIPSFGSSTTLPAPSAPTLSNSNPTANIPNFTISTVIPASSGIINVIEWFVSNNSTTGFVYLTNERPFGSNTFAAGSTVSDIITGLESGTWYFKCRAGAGSLFSDFSPASSSFVWNPQPAGSNNGTISTATFASEAFISGVSSGSYYPTMATNINDYEELKADSNFTFNAATNILTSGGLTLVNTTASSSTSTGALIVSGGAGIGGKLYATELYDSGQRVLTSEADTLDSVTDRGAVTNNSISIGKTLTLEVSTGAPGSFTTGTIAMANGVNWDPAGYSTTTAYLTYYNGSSWIAI